MTDGPTPEPGEHPGPSFGPPSEPGPHAPGPGMEPPPGAWQPPSGASEPPGARPPLPVPSAPSAPEHHHTAGFPPPGATSWPPPAGAVSWPPPGVPGPQPRPKYLHPVEPREYHWFWRVPGLLAWRPIVVILVGVVGFFLISLVVSIGGLLVDAINDPAGFEDVLDGLLAGEVTRALFIANSVALGLMIPLSFLLQRIAGQRPGYLSSVVGRTRWGWLLTCLGVSLAGVLLYFVLSIALEGWEALELAPQPGWLPLLVLILIVTPFQAAGEEYLVRGARNRAVASLLPTKGSALVLGAVVSSVVFALMHGAADPWLNLVYFTMGLMFCYLTWRTGGLEAAIAMHIANNLVGLSIVPFQEWGGLFDRSEGAGGPILLGQLFFLGIATVVIDVLARRRGLVAVSAPGA